MAAVQDRLVLMASSKGASTLQPSTANLTLLSRWLPYRTAARQTHQPTSHLALKVAPVSHGRELGSAASEETCTRACEITPAAQTDRQTTSIRSTRILHSRPPSPPNESQFHLLKSLLGPITIWQKVEIGGSMVIRVSQEESEGHRTPPANPKQNPITICQNGAIRGNEIIGVNQRHLGPKKPSCQPQLPSVEGRRLKVKVLGASLPNCAASTEFRLARTE
jgi:hypothetical protein